MHNYDFWGCQVELDRKATLDWYANADEWGCECGHCRNFLALAQKRALPTPVLETLDQLGIPPGKATYVCEIYPDGDGHRYQFSYRIAGNILQERSGEGKPERWGEGLCCHEPYPYGAPGFPQPHFDLEFWVTLPWVLEEVPNETDDS